MSTRRQSLETGGNKDGQIGKTLDQMLPVVTDASIILDDVRVLIGSAGFVGHEETKGAVAMISEVHRAKRITGDMADNGDVLLNIPADMVVALQKATSEVPYIPGNAA